MDGRRVKGWHEGAHKDSGARGSGSVVTPWIRHGAKAITMAALVCGVGAGAHQPAFAAAPLMPVFRGSGCCSLRAGRLSLRGASPMGCITSTRMAGDFNPFLPDLYGRLTNKQHSGGVDMLREGLNRLHMERDMQMAKVMKKIRAASYDMGEQDWNRLFTQFDSDQSGGLDFSEFERMCRSMGLHPTQMSSDELWIVYDGLDEERNGLVEVTSFTRWLSGKSAALFPVTENIGSSSAWTYGADYSVTMPIPEEIPSSSRELVVASKSMKDKKVFESILSTPTPQKVKVAPSAAFREPPVGASKLDMLVWEVQAFVDAPEGQLRELCYYFTNDLALTPQKVMGLAITAPGIFAEDLNVGVRPHVEYLKEIGVPVSRVGKILVAFPQVLELSLEKKEALVTFLEGLGMPLHSIGKCISSQPQLLWLSIDSKLAPTIEFLTTECRIPTERLGHLIASFPTILAYGIDSTLKPRLAYIRDELNVPRHRVGNLVLKFPQLLGLAVESNMQPTVRYMVSELGIPAEEISKIVQQHPQILGLSVEANLKPKVSFLLDEIGVPRERLARIISSFPTLLSLSIDANLRPKLNYLINEGFSREEVLKAPHLLAYSMKQRIQPRVEFLRNSNTKMALHSILCLSNQAFERRFDGYRAQSST